MLIINILVTGQQNKDQESSQLTEKINYYANDSVVIDLENKNYQKMNNFCIQLIRDCTKRKTFFGERNPYFQDFLYHILNRRM